MVVAFHTGVETDGFGDHTGFSVVDGFSAVQVGFWGYQVGVGREATGVVIVQGPASVIVKVVALVTV